MDSPKLTALQIMHAVFCLAIIIFATVTLLLNKETIHFELSTTSNYMILYPLFPLIGLGFIAFGLFNFNKQLSNLPEGATADEKIDIYLTVFLSRCAFLEGASLMNIVGFLMSANAAFLVVPAIGVSIFMLTRPNKQSIVDALSLSYPDTEKI